MKVSPNGRWTARQLARVLPLLTEQWGDDDLIPVEVTTQADRVQWFTVVRLVTRPGGVRCVARADWSTLFAGD